MTFQLWKVTTNTPKAEGLTAIEAWMLSCILFVFGALVGECLPHIYTSVTIHGVFYCPIPCKVSKFEEKKKQGHQIPWNFSYKRASGRVVGHFSFRYWTVGAAKKSIFLLRCSLSLPLLQYLSSAISFSEYAVILFNQQKQGSPNNRRAQHVKVCTPTFCFVDKCALFLTSLKMAAQKSPLCKISTGRLKYDFRLSAKKTWSTK